MAIPARAFQSRMLKRRRTVFRCSGGKCRCSRVARRSHKPKSGSARKRTNTGGSGHGRKADFIAYVRDHASELKAGTCGPRLLHHIAVSYHDFFFEDRKSTPRLRVAKLLGDEVDLTDAAIEGFGRVNERDDLPTLREVIRLDEHGKISLLALPILAGLDSLRPESLDSRQSAGDRKSGRTLLPHAPERGGTPGMVSPGACVPSGTGRRGVDQGDALPGSQTPGLFSPLGSLARRGTPGGSATGGFAPLACIPTRCTEPQISALHEILLAALTWEAEGLEEVVRQRVAKPDLDVSQRALWLAAGLLLSPDGYLRRVVKFVEGGEETRSRHMVRLPGTDRNETISDAVDLSGPQGDDQASGKSVRALASRVLWEGFGRGRGSDEGGGPDRRLGSHSGVPHRSGCM